MARTPVPESLLNDLSVVVSEITELEADWAEELAGVPELQRHGLRNLIHYIAFRRRDLRRLQHDLALLGLSSLGRSESHVLGNIDALRRALAALAGIPAPPALDAAVALDRGMELLRVNTNRLLGPDPTGRGVRIMVTMPTEAATNAALVRELVGAGMDVMRINCAHDDEAAWLGMVRHFREAKTSPVGPGRILMDVEGPKLRTGAIVDGPQVVSWNPPRTELGELERPATVWITRAERPVASRGSVPDAVLQLPAAFVDVLKPGGRITFKDHPGRSRLLEVVAVEPEGAHVLSRHSAFVTPGIEMQLNGKGGEACIVGPLPALKKTIELRSGDHLIVTGDGEPGRPASRDSAGRVLAPARISLSPREIFRDMRPGHRVMLDDGKAVGVVERVEADSAMLRITRCRGGRMNLGPEKGISLPDTELNVPALSDEDKSHLPFIAEHADMIGFSFVQRPGDIDGLREALARAGNPDLGLVLKIETAAAFSRLPELLVSALKSTAAGVMIARGDLATQIGYERLAEVQEEILWMCEAAHVPVIWATQVLETLAKKGLPSRSEITDAAMGERAECVMLNKGPFVLDAVRLLDDILRRMSGHQSKKRSMLRPLSIARRFGEGA